MSRPDRSSSRSPRSSRGVRSSSRPRRSQSSSVPLIGGLVGAIAIVVVVAILAGGGGSTAAGTSRDQPEVAPAKVTAPASSAPAATVDVDLSGGTARSGKTPDRPAPPIAAADLAAAETHYQRAKELWNDGQRARNIGDTATYTQAMDDAFDAMEEQREALRTYTDWYEEADLGDWAIPAEYTMLVRRLGEYDRLFQKIKKVKQIR